MADVQLKAVLTAEDKASNTLKKVGTAFTVMGAAAAAAAGVFITKSIKAAQDEEVAMAKVNAILKNLTGSLEKNTKAVDDAAKAAMKLGFDDEDASISMAKLLQVTKNTKDAQMAMSVAMDVSRLKGIDLESATQAVTMAYMGNTKLLKQLGIDIPDNAEKMTVLGLAHDKVKGQAEAFANTAAGASERFKVSVENLQEAVGKRALPFIAKFFGTISDFVNGDQLGMWLQRIGDFLNLYVAPAWKLAYDAIKPHIPLLKDIAKYIGIIAGGALLGAFIILSNTIAGIVVAIAKMIDLMKEAISLAKRIGSAPGNFTQGIADDFRAGLKMITGKASGGYVSGGTPYMVGERGPELFVPSNSGSIVPNNRMGGSVNINFNGAVVRSDSDLNRIITEVKRVLNRESVLEGLRV